LPKPGA
jgi:hypothetical protein